MRAAQRADGRSEQIPRTEPVPGWARACGIAAICAALPTVIWRVVAGCGATLGTPEIWRHDEHLPGSGTVYVVVLSLVQLAAALLTLVLLVPGADRVPRWSPIARGRRLPTWLVAGISFAGAAVLLVLCLLSAVNWSHVDPFGHATAVTGWSWLCWICYAVAPAWPLLLIATTIGYSLSRRSDRRGDRLHG